MQFPASLDLPLPVQVSPSLSSINGSAAAPVVTKKSIVKTDLGITAAMTKGNVVVTNSGKNILYARIITQGIPVKGDKTSAENKLKLKG